MDQPRIVPIIAGLVLWVGAFVPLRAAPQPQVELTAPQLLERVQQWLDGTRDLEARFTQTLLSGALGSGLEESGRLYVLRPGKMRWDYLEPERKVALVEGQKTRLYVEEDRQLFEGRLDEQGGLLPALLTGEDRLAALFRATLAPSIPAAPEGVYRLKLVPTSEAQSFEEAVLTVRAPQFAIEVAEVLDRAGNRMLYRFSGTKRNRGLPTKGFRFEPPPGTEILTGP